MARNHRPRHRSEEARHLRSLVGQLSLEVDHLQAERLRLLAECALLRAKLAMVEHELLEWEDSVFCPHIPLKGHERNGQ